MPCANDFRRIALAMKGVVEGAHMGHPDFRVGGRIFATLHQDLQNGMVKLTPDQQRRFVKDHAGAFMPENGAWGLQGSTRVQLSEVDEDALGEALTRAWQNTVRKTRAPKKSASRRTPRPKKKARE